MKSQTARASRSGRIAMATAGLASAATLLAGCAAPAEGGDGGTGGGAEGDAIGVSLIVKTVANPFFVAIQEGAEAAAEEAGVELTFAAGSEDGDEAGQITAIENAIARGDAGILIALNGPGVNSAIERAREAGL